MSIDETTKMLRVHRDHDGALCESVLPLMCGMMFIPKLNELGSGDYTSGGFSADEQFVVVWFVGFVS